MSKPVVRSIQFGAPRWHGAPGSTDAMDRPFHTGFWKEPVAGPVRVTVTGLAGDGQADLVNHGGPDKAVLAYSADHYPGWRTELGVPDLTFGGLASDVEHLSQLLRSSAAPIDAGKPTWDEVGNAEVSLVAVLERGAGRRCGTFTEPPRRPR